ncbi:MAG: hypothetical protein AAGM38_06135 [Pseudomonadota bacterium]
MTHSPFTLLAAAALAALPFAAAQAQTPPNAAKERAAKERAAENFLQADANADGALNRSEFETLIDLNADDDIGRANMVRRFGRYDMAFSRVDANQDGFATPEEMRALAAQARN